MGLILLVEDEPGAAALLRRYIENSSDGHRLAVFGKAAEALSFAAQNKVDLFILDIQLLDYWQGSCGTCRNTGLPRSFSPRNWPGRSCLPTGKLSATIFW